MAYSQESISRIVGEQRRFFRSGETLPVKWRIEQLKKLKRAVIEHRKRCKTPFMRIWEKALSRRI